MDFNEFPHGCKFCKNGTYIKISREVMCMYHGVVSQKHICKKYTFDPFKVKIKRMRVIDVSKYKAEDFSIE